MYEPRLARCNPKAHDRSTKSVLPAGAADADNSRGLATKAGNMLRIYDADAVLTISKFLVEEDERDVVEPRVDVSVRVAKLAFYRLQRSEEHTSELQSLMRISYAVFCLKKKKQNYETTRIQR